MSEMALSLLADSVPIWTRFSFFGATELILLRFSEVEVLQPEVIVVVPWRDRCDEPRDATYSQHALSVHVDPENLPVLSRHDFNSDVWRCDVEHLSVVCLLHAVSSISFADFGASGRSSFLM